MAVLNLPRSQGKNAIVLSGDVWDRVAEALESVVNMGFAPPLMIDEGPWGRTLRLAWQSNGPKLLHIISATAGGGQYVARVVKLPATWNSSANLDLSTLEDEDDDVLFINLQENQDGSGHWLTDASNTKQRYFTPTALWGITDDEGRTIYAANGNWFAVCEPGEGGGGSGPTVYEQSLEPSGATIDGDIWIQT